MQLEKIFKVLNCTEEQMVNWASFVMEGEAEHWWSFVVRQRDLAGTGQPLSHPETLHTIYLIFV